jgi:hypothetical protein
MSITIDGGAGITFPDTVQQTNAVTNTGGVPRYYAARAWGVFDGTGTVSIRAAVNVSSITDAGAGEYTVNFTTAMPDVNYVALTSGTFADGGGSNNVIQILDLASGGLYSTTQVTFLGQNSSGSNQDSEFPPLAAG